MYYQMTSSISNGCQALYGFDERIINYYYYYYYYYLLYKGYLYIYS
jgi:hypothetical protein